MKILCLSFYYPPDLSAGSFRMKALIETLQQHLPKHAHIDVITSLPHRYDSFRVETSTLEEKPGLCIHRIALPFHKGSFFGLCKTFLHYARFVFKKVKHQDYDLVFATSSRLMTAALGASLAKKKNIPLYLDIRDIFVESLLGILPKAIAAPVAYCFSLLERYTVHSAKKINLVSPGFKDYFQNRYPGQQYSFFTNGIDTEFINPQQAPSVTTRSPPYAVIYAGNIGDGQGLHHILPELASKTQGLLEWTIIGDGGRKNALKKALLKASVTNLVLENPMHRADLLKLYLKADVLFLHLNHYDAFKKVLPSKLFEYAALGKPLWAGACGYAAHFIETEIDNAVVFPPCDAKLAIQLFQKLQLHTKPRTQFIQKYARCNIMQAFTKDILSLLANT